MQRHQLTNRRLSLTLKLIQRFRQKESLMVAFVAEEVARGRGIFGLYPATDPQTLTDFAEWRKKNGR